MELLVFGHGGMAVIVFPTSMGRFFDYENRRMIDVRRDRYDRGELQAFCVDSVDGEGWYNKSVPPGARAARHVEYDRYIANEVVPFIAITQWRTARGDRLQLRRLSFGELCAAPSRDDSLLRQHGRRIRHPPVHR